MKSALLFSFSNLLILSVPDEGYSRKILSVPDEGYSRKILSVT
jgi:hypothetical protein